MLRGITFTVVTLGVLFAGLAQSQTALATVRLPRAVLADGRPVAAGNLYVRLTSDALAPAAGQAAGAERWVELLRGGQVVGREVATIIADDEIGAVAKAGGKSVSESIPLAHEPTQAECYVAGFFAARFLAAAFGTVAVTRTDAAVFWPADSV